MYTKQRPEVLQREYLQRQNNRTYRTVYAEEENV